MNIPTVIHSLGDDKDRIIDTLPNQGRWTEEEYLWLTSDTIRLVELTDGYLEPLPMPTRRHQAILRLLCRLLDDHLTATGGAVYPAGLRLRVRPGKFREADLTAFKDVDDPRSADDYCSGADLAVEIVSPRKPERDYVDKREDYAEAVIPEYWIVDPADETITVLHYQGGAYVEHAVHRRGDTAAAVTLLGFSVSVDAVFDAK